MQTIEIEKKYHFSDERIFMQVQAFLARQHDYVVTFGDEQTQTDTYYDTPDGLLERAGASLRIRRKGVQCEVAVKLPAGTTLDDGRFEFQKPIDTPDLDGQDAFIQTHLQGVAAGCAFSPCLTVVNRRTPISLCQGAVQFELVFDRVRYQSPEGREAAEFQLEVELKSDGEHRPHLDAFAKKLKNAVRGLTPSETSKYQRGLTLLSAR